MTKGLFVRSTVKPRGSMAALHAPVILDHNGVP
jgi:hypothetical protein